MRKVIPSMVTFISLLCGILALLRMVQGDIVVSGALILVAYILDALDGELARRLDAMSPFGLQLDSLIDTVVFGVAAPFLMVQHLQDSSLPWWLVGLGMMVFTMAGIFRLARFNLSARGDKPRQTTGLTISTSAAFLTLSVLVDCTFESSPLPDWSFLLIALFLATLMISRIRFPELGVIFSYRLRSSVALGLSIVAAIWLTPQLVWLLITIAYVTFGVGRAVYGIWK